MKLLLAVLLLSGCAINDPIGAHLTHGSILTADLTATALNLDQAVAVGALSRDDPAPACLHELMVRAGVGQDTFEPQVKGLLSLKSIAYIKAKQIANRGTLPVACKAIVADILIP